MPDQPFGGSLTTDADQHRGRRFALVGTGHRAEMYVVALLGSHAAAGELVAWCDPNPGRIAYYERLRRSLLGDSACDELPAYSPDRFEEMIRAEDVDVVLVTTTDRWHAAYIAKALDLGCDVISEKPLTIDVLGCRQVLDAVDRNPGELVVTFNYRYSPRNSVVKRLIAEGAIGDVTSITFEWVLDTVHGADYFRRWHRDKTNSGGLLVHKASHHFDLVNWWLDDVPVVVFAMGSLAFYGARAAAARGLGPRPERSHGQPIDDFALDLERDPRLRALYLEAEGFDGYLRDRDVFSDGITIEDNLGVLVRYSGGPVLTYALNAHAPWEGYQVVVNGTRGRLELNVVERAAVNAEGAVDPSATPEPHDHRLPDAATARRLQPRHPGSTLLVQNHWEPARVVDIDELALADPHRKPRGGAHGGGDLLLLDDVLFGPGRAGPDSLRRAAGPRDGVLSVLVGAAANLAIASGRPVDLGEFGLPIDGLRASQGVGTS